MRANQKLLKYVQGYIAWAHEIGVWGNLKNMLKVSSQEEILERFRHTDDAVPLAQEFARAIGYLQARNNLPFAYGFADPPDLCGRQVACRPMAE